MNKNKPELLLPAGNIKTLKTAFRYGADACYIGYEQFSLRAKADNFSKEELKEAIEYAHSINKKIYIAVNIYANNDDIEKAYSFFDDLNILKPDGVLISDMGLFNIAKEKLKNISIHISTQANTTNYEAVTFYKNIGAKRVVLARELTLKQIKEIKEKNKDIEIETFVHGAMCISYSGRCLLSSFMANRSANHGECTHPCRWKYTLIEEQRPDEEYSIEEDKRGTYIFNSKDLDMISHIDDLIDAGIDVFKIEGRMKGELYIATIARAYRKAIDLCIEDINEYKKLIPTLEEEVRKTTYREYTTGFYFEEAEKDLQIYNNNTYICNAKYYGTVYDIKEEYCYIEQKNKFDITDILEVIYPDFTNEDLKIIDMIDEETNKHIVSCPHAKQKLKIKFDKKLHIGDIIRSK